MEWRPLSGARRWRLCSLGSSTLTLRRSARKPICRISSGLVPGMVLAWI